MGDPDKGQSVLLAEGMLEPGHRIPRFFFPSVLGVVSPQGSIIAGAKEMGHGPGHL